MGRAPATNASSTWAALGKRREGVGVGVVRVWRGAAGVARCGCGICVTRDPNSNLPASARWIVIAPLRRAADVRQWRAPYVRVRGAACA